MSKVRIYKVQNQYTITKHALATLLAGDEENLSNTILGLGIFLTAIDNAILSLFSLAVSSLGTNNFHILPQRTLRKAIMRMI